MRPPGRTLFDIYTYCIYERNSDGQLRHLPWDSTWENVRSTVERRKAERRKTSIAASEERRKCERRDGLRCEVCRRRFPEPSELYAHLPCRANQKRVDLGFRDFIEGLADRRGASIGETEQLRKIIAASLSEDAYLKSCKEYLFPRWPERPGEENRKQYRMEWLASLLTLIRPNEINANALSRIDRQEISRIAETFVRLPDGPQKKIIRQLCSPSIALEETAKSGRLPARPISDKTRRAFVLTADLTGKRRADALTQLEADHWAPRTPRETYDEDPERFSRDLYRLKSKIPRKPRRNRTTQSSPASD